MTDDLVERLREYCTDYPYEGERLAQEAADRIKELEAKLEQAAEIMSIYCDPMNMEPEHERFLYDLNKEFP